MHILAARIKIFGLSCAVLFLKGRLRHTEILLTEN